MLAFLFSLLFVSGLCDPSRERRTRLGPQVITQRNGRPVGNNQNSLLAGERGPVLLTDTLLVEKLSSIANERTPERLVHAKGAAAHGVFEVTHDITRYTKASLFSRVGKKTPTFTRFSTTAGSLGAADTVRDPRGFATRFYTEEGNYDLLTLNTPVFFIRDAMKFPDLIHSQKNSPVDGLFDPNMFWDFLSLTPESLAETLFVFSDRGIPASYRFMDGFAGNTFHMVNDKGEVFLVKFTWKSRQGVKNLSNEEAAEIAGRDPDHDRRDLYESIRNREFPSYDLFIQVMTPEEAASFEFDVLDVTKVWSTSRVPLQPVGRLTLNALPENFFNEVEQVAYAPSNLVPGIEPSADKLLHGRFLIYPITHRNRIGANAQQVPINCPFRSAVGSGKGLDYFVQEGAINVEEFRDDFPNYEPNSAGPNGANTYREDPRRMRALEVSGLVDRYPFTHPNSDFTQPGSFYRDVLTDSGRSNLVDNLVGDLGRARRDIQERMVSQLYLADPELGRRVAISLRRRA